MVVDPTEIVRTTEGVEKSTEILKTECLERFMKAVREGRKGNYGTAKALVEKMRAQFGDKAAVICRRELWAYMASEKKA